MKYFLIALQFLTVLPIRIKPLINKEDFGKSLLYFPLVGAILGILLSLIASMLGFLPNLVIAALVLIVSAALTGGIHLDGFADTCDGFYGHKSKERILQIMRDSRIGAIGVIGIVSLLLLKFSLIAAIAKFELWKALIVMAVFSRWSQVFACYISSYARKDGKAKYFTEYCSKKEAFAGAAFVFCLSFLLMQFKAFIVLAVSVSAVFLFINWIKKKIGGMTGDTIGAVSEISEVLILFLYFILTGGIR